jgi:hypothetical protein
MIGPDLLARNRPHHVHCLDGLDRLHRLEDSCRNSDHRHWSNERSTWLDNENLRRRSTQRLRIRYRSTRNKGKAQSGPGGICSHWFASFVST